VIYQYAILTYFQVLVLKENKTKQKSATFESSAGKESLPLLLPYTKELKNVKNRLLCSKHGGDNILC
jgi:hypothetical protein